MTKIGLLFLSFLFAPYICYGQSATTRSAGQDFPPLNSGIEFSTMVSDQVHVVKLNITTEAKFKGQLVSDEGWSDLEEEDKWQVAIYEYSYKFENNSDERLSVLFTNWDVLSSPLVEVFGDYDLVLEPGETRIIRFSANTKVQEAYGGSTFYSLWDEKNKRWHLFGASAASLYVPRFNALFERLE